MRDYARIYSRSQFVSTLGVAFGPLLLGVVHDAVDGYSFPYTLAAMMSIGGAALAVRRWPDGDRGRSGRSQLGQLAGRVGHDVAPAGVLDGAPAPRQGDAEQVAVDEGVGLQEDAQPAAPHQLGPVAVARTQGVGSSGGDHVERGVEACQARREHAAGVVDELGVVDEEERVTIGRDVELVQPRSDDVVQRGVDRRRRSWGDRAQPGTGMGAPDLAAPGRRARWSGPIWPARRRGRGRPVAPPGRSGRGRHRRRPRGRRRRVAARRAGRPSRRGPAATRRRVRPDVAAATWLTVALPPPREGQGRRPAPRVPGRPGGPAPGTSWAHRRAGGRTSRARTGRPGGTATSGPRSPPAPRECPRADPPRWPPPHRPPVLRPAHGRARRGGRSGGPPPARLAAPGGRRSARAGGAEAGGSTRRRAVGRAPCGAPGRTVRCAPDRRP